MIDKKSLPYKYRHEIFANEIVLLAYYIASINIENVYQGIMGDSEEQINFEGICLTDTFNLYEDTMRKEEQKNSVWGEEADNEMLKINNLSITKENSERIRRQQEIPINVIISNPPYSAGQKSANDNNKNQHYPLLEKKIQNTYVKYSKVQNTSTFDSYIKAIRWATDKIKDNGVVGFITNNGWLDSKSADGLRKCLNEDYTDIYIIDLKGNIRKFDKSEGENIFGVMVGCAIYFLVKNNDKKEHNIYYYNVGDGLRKQEKLNFLVNLQNIESLDKQNLFKKIVPNRYYDWLTQRGDTFYKNNFIPINPDVKYDINSQSWFITYSLGLATGRDVWCYNFSKKRLKENIKTTIDYYNDQRIKIMEKGLQKEPIKDDTKCNWAENWNKYLKKNEIIEEEESSYNISIYRPFCKYNVYFNKYLNERVHQLPNIFPHGNGKNLCIIISTPSSKNFFCCVTYLNDTHIMGDTQNFPLHYYIQNGNKLEKHDNITDFILNNAREKYSNKSIVKEDLFYYVYGILHSENYRNIFKNDLFRTLARIPLVNDYENFEKLSKIGRRLADLHINYEDVKLKDNRGVKVIINKNIYENDKDIVKNIDSKFSEEELYSLYKIDKMKFVNKEKSSIIFNNSIRIENIPSESYNYILNGKSAIDWVVARYSISVDKNSGIKNDPNDWCRESGNPKYIFNLLLSVIEVSLETLEILKEIPDIDFEKLN